MNEYCIEVYRGFMKETDQGFEMPRLIRTRYFTRYRHAKGYYRECKALGIGTVLFYRNGELVLFKGE